MSYAFQKHAAPARFPRTTREVYGRELYPSDFHQDVNHGWWEVPVWVAFAVLVGVLVW